MDELLACDSLIGSLLATIKSQDHTSPLFWKSQMGALGHCFAARVINSLVLMERNSGDVSCKLSNERMRKVAAYLKSCPGSSVGVLGMATAAGLSPGHFGKLFKATFRKTPERYILDLRLFKAKDMICTGDYNISEVAQMNGFCDQSHLAKQFRRLFHVTPQSLLPNRKK
ncbi:MAG: helix-turn-helix transcriptional regulator [Opitutaceae bacterium]|nr:helix-turn-helix transcriptional regulator [Cephaloticoccus sp.]MCP5530484.1 helix-turn-helix transcriptional regulator [Opitutaceae bacterium]